MRNPKPDPLDLILQLYKKGEREFLSMKETKRLLDYIPELVGEIRRLRSNAFPTNKKGQS